MFFESTIWRVRVQRIYRTESETVDGNSEGGLCERASELKWRKKGERKAGMLTVRPRDRVIYERSTPFPHSHRKTVGRSRTRRPTYRQITVFWTQFERIYRKTTTATTKRGNCWYYCRTAVGVAANSGDGHYGAVVRVVVDGRWDW